MAASAAALVIDGFTWAWICTVLAEESAELLTRQNPHGTRYLPDGRPIRPGAVIRLPGVATAVEQWADAGPRWLQNLRRELIEPPGDHNEEEVVDDTAEVHRRHRQGSREDRERLAEWRHAAPVGGPGMLAAEAQYRH